MPIHDWTRVYAGLFHDFHQSWSIYIKNALNARVAAEGHDSSRRAEGRAEGTRRLGCGCLCRTAHAVMTTVPWRPWRRLTTRIVRKSSKEFYSDLANRIVVKHQLGRTVAVIEIVSPGNKDSKRAFKQFIDKSLEFIRSGVHLLVVDLFPPTKRDPFGVHRADLGRIRG